MEEVLNYRRFLLILLLMLSTWFSDWPDGTINNQRTPLSKLSHHGSNKHVFHFVPSLIEADAAQFPIFAFFFISSKRGAFAAFAEPIDKPLTKNLDQSAQLGEKTNELYRKRKTSNVLSDEYSLLSMPSNSPSLLTHSEPKMFAQTQPHSEVAHPLTHSAPPSASSQPQQSTPPPYAGSYPLSQRIVKTKYGDLQGVLISLANRQLASVEAFFGVPYASPPVGTLRFMPPVTTARWMDVRVADTFAPVCPQKFPDVSNETEALKHMPRQRFEYLRRLQPYLQNQSEDCLYLNVYVTEKAFSQDESSGIKQKLPVMVYIHGESFEWNSGNTYDGSILASYGDVIVVTVNYRLGILGFLTVVNDPSKGNYGLMDQVAALNWVVENIREFGGDPKNITLFGHDRGAACVNFLMISPVAKGLFHRAILMSGSALAHWALVQDPLKYTAQISAALNCPVTSTPSPPITTPTGPHGEMETKENVKPSPELSVARDSSWWHKSIVTSSSSDREELIKCFRAVNVSDLLDVKIDVPAHLTAFGPTVDGIVIPADPHNFMHSLQEVNNHYDLMFGVVLNEGNLEYIFSNDEFTNGFGPDKKARILRTFVRNVYHFHMSEIYSVLNNEYTDWMKPIQHPANIRDSTMELLGDAQYVAPVVRAGDMHSAAYTNTYFYVFECQGSRSAHDEYPNRANCLHGDELPYVFGGSIMDDVGFFRANSTKAERKISEAVMKYWTNFARTGDPNDQDSRQIGTDPTRNKNRFDKLVWPQYETVHQKYLAIETRPKIKHHFRAHKMSVWLKLIPDIHKPGGPAVNLQHHLLESHDDMSTFEGSVRPISRPYGVPMPSAIITTSVPFAYGPNSPIIPNPIHGTSPILHGNHSGGHGSGVYPNTHYKVVPRAGSSAEGDHPTHHEDSGTEGSSKNGTDPMRVEAVQQGSYSTALSVTIAVGCSLLILNVLIFAGVYYQRDKNRIQAKLNERIPPGKGKEHEDGLSQVAGLGGQGGVPISGLGLGIGMGTLQHHHRSAANNANVVGIAMPGHHQHLGMGINMGMGQGMSMPSAIPVQMMRPMQNIVPEKAPPDMSGTPHPRTPPPSPISGKPRPPFSAATPSITVPSSLSHVGLGYPTIDHMGMAKGSNVASTAITYVTGANFFSAVPAVSGVGTNTSLTSSVNTGYNAMNVPRPIIKSSTVSSVTGVEQSSLPPEAQPFLLQNIGQNTLPLRPSQVRKQSMQEVRV